MTDLDSRTDPPGLPPPASGDAGAGAAATPPPLQRGDRRWWLWAVVLPLIVVLAAGLVRFHRLGLPERCYFDETYYYYDARDYLEVGTETSFAVHPPVGKWLIAVGLVAFGVDEGSPIDAAVTDDPGECVVRDDEPDNPAARAREAAESFARRAMAALFGTAAVGLTYLAGLRLFRRRSVALLGAALLAVDGLAVTMSRIAMLDIFLQLFTVLGFLLILIDRDRLWAGAPAHTPLDEDGTPVGELPDQPGRGWLWAAGVALGLAVATKLSGLAPLGLAVLFVLGSELAWRRRWTGRWTTGLAPAVARGFLAFAIVPIAVYLASYAGWFANFEDTRKADRCEPAAGAVEDPCAGLDGVQQVFGGWWEEQGEILRFHRDLEADHPYRAPASTWPLMTRPVAYYYESCPAEGPADGEECATAPGSVAEVLGMGNPAIWWTALLGYPFLLWSAVVRRRWQAAAIALFLFGQAVPYLFSPRPVFLFYLTPVVPFIALSLAQVSDEALDSRQMRWVPALITVLALAGFAIWAPVFLGFEIPRGLWQSLMLFDSWIS